MIEAAITHFRRAYAFRNDAIGAHRIEDQSRYLASAVDSAVGIVDVLLAQVVVRRLSTTSLIGTSRGTVF